MEVPYIVGQQTNLNSVVIPGYGDAQLALVQQIESSRSFGPPPFREIVVNPHTGDYPDGRGGTTVKSFADGTLWAMYFREYQQREGIMSHHRVYFSSKVAGGLMNAASNDIRHLPVATQIAGDENIRAHFNATRADYLRMMWDGANDSVLQANILTTDDVQHYGSAAAAIDMGLVPAGLFVWEPRIMSRDITAPMLLDLSQVTIPLPLNMTREQVLTQLKQDISASGLKLENDFNVSAPSKSQAGLIELRNAEIAELAEAALGNLAAKVILQD